jgi:hypothetical protein
MSLRNLGRFVGLSLVAFSMLVALPGCGGEGGDGGAGEAVEAIPPVNPAPGAMEDESKFQ